MDHDIRRSFAPREKGARMFETITGNLFIVGVLVASALVGWRLGGGNG